MLLENYNLKKTKERDTATHLLDWGKSKTPIPPSGDKHVGQQDTHPLLQGAGGTAAFQDRWAVSLARRAVTTVLGCSHE